MPTVAIVALVETMFVKKESKREDDHGLQLVWAISTQGHGPVRASPCLSVYRGVGTWDEREKTRLKEIWKAKKEGRKVKDQASCVRTQFDECRVYVQCVPLALH